MKAVILGAGAMGAALTFPLCDNAHDVNLWGTEYDTNVLDAISKGESHAKLGVKLPEKISLFYSDQLERAMDGADAVVIGVTSDAVDIIAKRISSFIAERCIVLAISKGLGVIGGRTVTVLETIENRILDETGIRIPVVAVGGPSIAGELARRLPTGAIYASESIEIARQCKDILGTSYYKVEISSDCVGVELCAALKNVYAISVGWTDGIMKRKGEKTMNNARAYLFTKAVEEMKMIVGAKGGKEPTVTGLAGLGDLEVTCRGGRNGAFGELIGLGLSAREALDEMKNKGVGVIEGYVATKHAYELLESLEKEGRMRREDAQLLKEIHDVLYENKPVEKSIAHIFS